MRVKLRKEHKLHMVEDSILVNFFILAIGVTINDMEKVSTSIKMEINLWVTGQTIKSMAMLLN